MAKLWQPRDIVALVALIGALSLRAIGVDSLTEWITVALIIGYLGLSMPRRRP